MEFRKNILLKMILPLLFIVPVSIWFRLTPASYEKTVKIREMLVKKERTWIPFYTKTVDTIQTTGKQGYSETRE